MGDEPAGHEPAGSSMAEFPARIGVTGVSGYLGQSLLEELAGAGYDGRVVGIDVKEPVAAPDFLEFNAVDATTAEAARLLAGCDAVVHLAYVFQPTKDPEAETAANLGMFEQVLDAVRRTEGPVRLVVASSATAYGAYENNPVPLTEEAPLRPNEGFVYATCKGEIERRLAAFEEERPDVVVTVLRPVIVLGPHTTNYLAAWLTTSPPVAATGARPPMQFVHERDVTAAIGFALTRDLPGAFNLGADGWITADEIDSLLGNRRPLLRIPPDAFRRLASRLWDLGVTPIPPAGLPYLQHPWVVANTKITNAGMAPEYSNAQALQAAHVRAQRDRKARRPRWAGLRPVALLAFVLALVFWRLRRRQG